MIMVIDIMIYIVIDYCIIFLIIFEVMIDCWIMVVCMINIFDFMIGVWIIICVFMIRESDEMIIIEVIFVNICLKVGII